MTVDFLTRVVIVGLACYAAGSTLAALTVGATWRRVVRAMADAPPRRIAARLLALRAAPAAIGAITTLMAVGAFTLFEANRGDERVGTLMIAVALAGAALVAVAGARLAWILEASLRLRRQWPDSRALRIDGCPIGILRADTVFPVVALMGWFRPRLIVATRVLEACTPAELQAVIAHEMAHLASRDNLRRLLFDACPDVLIGSRAARGMERAWTEATELAADDHAAGQSQARRLDLASALVKLARLAVDVPAPPLPASALFRGEPVADRVRRLMSPPADTAHLTRLAPFVLAAATAMALALPGVLPWMHDLVEAAITFGR